MKGPVQIGLGPGVEIVKTIGMIVFGVALVAFSLWFNVAYRKWIVKQAITEMQTEQQTK